MSRLKNIKHEHFCREYIENNGNGTQAYKEAYPLAANNSANVNSSKLLTKTTIQERISALLEDKHGSKLSVLLSDLVELKKANKTIFNERIKHEIADNPVRLSAITTLLRLHNLLTPNTQQIDARSINYTITPERADRLEGICDRLERIQARTDDISGFEKESGRGA